MFKPTLKKKSSINIIPMIDVIFFLLVFFMLFTSFRSTPQGLDLQLPRAVTATEQQSENIMINVDEKGRVFYEGENLSLAELSEIIDKQINDSKNVTAVINADEETRYKHVVAVMDSLRNTGIYKLALAAEKKRDENAE